MLDRPKLIKLMMMTTTQNDGEALTAIRKANVMLKVNNVSWSSLLDVPTSAPRRPAPPPPKRKPSGPMGRGTSGPAASNRQTFDDPSIPRMIQSLLRDTKGSFRDFVERMDDAWNEYGHLTGPQYDAILNAYEMAK